MFKKIKNRTTNPLRKKALSIKNLRDTRMIGLMAFGAVALLVTWNGVGVIQTNYELQQQISRLEQENELRVLENENLRLRNQYFKTNHYLELQARKQFSKAAPGETLILVPESVALAHSQELPEKPEPKTVQDKPAKPTYQRNFEAWMEFLFRRNARTF